MLDFQDILDFQGILDFPETLDFQEIIFKVVPGCPSRAGPNPAPTGVHGKAFRAPTRASAERTRFPQIRLAGSAKA